MKKSRSSQTSPAQQKPRNENKSSDSDRETITLEKLGHGLTGRTAGKSWSRFHRTPIGTSWSRFHRTLNRKSLVTVSSGLTVGHLGHGFTRRVVKGTFVTVSPDAR
ncbi:hypothetical protein ACLKA6_010118 [Drosophila palustris]